MQLVQRNMSSFKFVIRQQTKERVSQGYCRKNASDRTDCHQNETHPKSHGAERAERVYKQQHFANQIIVHSIVTCTTVLKPQTFQE